MEIFTLLLGCVIHITLILVLEGIVLIGILYPILHRIVNYMTTKFQRTMFVEILIRTWFNSLLKGKIPTTNQLIPIAPELKPPNLQDKQQQIPQFTQYNPLIPTTPLFGGKSNFENLGIINWDLNPITMTYEYTFFEPINVLLKACAIDEKKYLKVQDNMPYIVYGILLFVLVVCGLIILVIVNSYNIAINYKFIIITSAITFLLVSIYAFLVLYFILATQPYVLNFEDNFYKAFLDTYNSV
jgi:hypothetical protein